MILVDSSIWIDYFRGTKHQKTLLFDSILTAENDICVCGLIITEVLQGIREDKIYQNIKQYFERLVYLHLEKEHYLLASNIYRDCRKRGITIRNSIDCLIASCSILYKTKLLENDRDFTNLAKYNRGLFLVE